MSSLESLLQNITVTLDARSKESVARINDIIDKSGRMTMLMSIAHFFGWMDKEAGPINIATTDWQGFAKTLYGVNAIQLIAIRNISGTEAARFQLMDGGGQREFWESVRGAAEKALRNNAAKAI